MNMKNIAYWSVIYISVIAIMICGALGGSSAVTAISEQVAIKERKTVIIDPGHGGEDGGATSCSGVLESKMNLDISLRLNDMMHLLGVHTVMVRTQDISIYTSGATIAAKKVSDLKERVKLVDRTNNAVLISIHQNYFNDSRYNGAQVFYAQTQNSKDFAQNMQSALKSNLNQRGNRNIKQAKGVYLMEHIRCPGILIECGFLSNPEEEALLRSDVYQKKLAVVIATVTSAYLNDY